MPDRKKGIAVAGSMNADIFYEIDTYPEESCLTKIRNVVNNVGGSGNLIIDLAKLDPKMAVKVSTIIGEGSNGRMILGELDKYPNIDQRNITKEGKSSVTLVMNAQDTKQRTFFFLPAASDIYEEKYIDWEAVDADIFHLEYLLLMAKVDSFDSEFGTHGARILHEARARGMKTSIDIVSEQSDRALRIVSAALKYTDYCAVNEIEAAAVTGVELVKENRVDETKVKDALLKMNELGVTTWAVIHSSQAGYGYDCRKKEFVKVPSLSLPKGYIKGSNGAGDAYCSGILYGAYQEMSLKQAMELGTAAAACSLSQENGTDGMRSYEETMRLFEEMKAE